MKVVVIQMLEFAACRRKQLLTGSDIGIHRSANVKKHQHLYRVVALGHHADIQQPRVAGSRTDRILQIKLLVSAVARKFAQSP